MIHCLRWSSVGARQYLGGAPSLVMFRRRRRRSAFVVMGAKIKKDCHYSTLNVTRDASLQDIKAAYRNLARKFHPDMNKDPAAEEKFKKISAAYEVLSDNEKRSLYDVYGESGLESGDGQNTTMPTVDPFDMFNALFGQSNAFFGGRDFDNMIFSRRKPYEQNIDISHNLFLGFEEAVFGGQKAIHIEVHESCDYCHGTGAKSKSSIRSCSECSGRGGIMKSKRTRFGVVSQVTPCPNCDGDGKIIMDPCMKCGGEGMLKKMRTVNINIPAGVGNGIVMQVQGEGNFHKERDVRGDLYLIIHVHEKPGFTRDGLNLLSTAYVHYTSAILGGVIQVETLEGYTDLQLPSGTQHGDTFRIPNMGVPSMKDSSVRGDHLITISIQIPKEISESERSLIEQLALLHTSKEHSITSKNSLPKFVRDGSHNIQIPRLTALEQFQSLFKVLFGKKRSDTRFASTSLEARLVTGMRYSKMDAKLISLFIVFLLMHISFSSAIRLFCRKGE